MNTYEDEQKLINMLGQALYTVWSELCKAIDAVYEMEHIWNNGAKRGNASINSAKEKKRFALCTHKKIAWDF